MEAEYIVPSEAVKEAIWLQLLASDFKDSGPESKTTPILVCDSHLVHNPIIHMKTKHIGVLYHHIRKLNTEIRHGAHTQIIMKRYVNPWN